MLFGILEQVQGQLFVLLLLEQRPKENLKRAFVTVWENLLHTKGI